MSKRPSIRIGLLAAVVLAAPVALLQGASSAGASTLPAVDCGGGLFGGDYLATPSGHSVTVTLNSDCTSAPYYLVVYSAPDNQVLPVITNGSDLCNPVDASSYCSYPASSDFPQYLLGSTPFTGSTATVNLPLSGCWQVDVVNSPLSTPSQLNVLTDGPGNFVWGEIGPLGGACQTTTTYSAALTPGYWKNHLSQTEGLISNQEPFSLGNYELTGTASTIGDQVTLTFKAMNCGKASQQDAIGCLVGQLLAAELNAANGANTSSVQATMSTAQAFLTGSTVTYDGVTAPGVNYTGPTATFTLTSAQRTVAIDLANDLSTYNSSGI